MEHLPRTLLYPRIAWLAFTLVLTLPLPSCNANGSHLENEQKLVEESPHLHRSLLPISRMPAVHARNVSVESMRFNPLSSNNRDRSRVFGTNQSWQRGTGKIDQQLLETLHALETEEEKLLERLGRMREEQARVRGQIEREFEAQHRIDEPIQLHQPSRELQQREPPRQIFFRGGVLHAPPLAYVERKTGVQGTATQSSSTQASNVFTDENEDISVSGFQYDLLEFLKAFAREDGIDLVVDLQESPMSYNDALDLIANDCNTTANPHPLQDCQKFDVIIGDFWGTAERWNRVNYTPSWLHTTLSVIKHLEKPDGSIDFTTITEVVSSGKKICGLADSAVPSKIEVFFPRVEFHLCSPLDACIDELKAGMCALYIDDELQLRYRESTDPTIEVTNERFSTQFIMWPYRKDLAPETAFYLNRWLYAAMSNGTFDEVYRRFFNVATCPLGFSGENCDQPCDPVHGLSDRFGVCVCESIRWIGDDCSTEVLEEVNLIPPPIKMFVYSLFGINFVVVIICFAWMFIRRKSSQVSIAQPFFLALVLVGCLTSSSTILALTREDEGDGPVIACMFIPWLYSVGFCITFGTLYAKIRRVYILFQSASQMKRKTISIKETLVIIGAVLAIDVLVLTVWTIREPIQWRRVDTLYDEFNFPLESYGYCASDNWIYLGLICTLHAGLLLFATYVCFASRNISSRFQEGKSVAVAMVSNLQIFVIGVPVLVVIRDDHIASFFILAAIIWMNDLMVVGVIFGNLMYQDFLDRKNKTTDTKSVIRSAIQEFTSSHYELHHHDHHQSMRNSMCTPSEFSSYVDRDSTIGMSTNRQGSASKVEDHTIFAREHPIQEEPSSEESEYDAESNESSDDGDEVDGASLPSGTQLEKPEVLCRANREETEETVVGSEEFFYNNESKELGDAVERKEGKPMETAPTAVR